MTTTAQTAESKANFIIQSRRKVDGTTIVEAGFETAKEALNAIDELPSTMEFGGVRVCRRSMATGELMPWTEWM